LFTNRLDPAGIRTTRIHHLRVSAHYFIRRGGELVCFVPPEKRAWHAGVSSWRGRERCNDFSIGIELEGCDSLPFEPAQYETLAGLLAELCGAFRWRASPAIRTSRRAQDRPGPVLFVGAPAAVLIERGRARWLS
jgi:N-acetyl-anhydromuramyl-L-alanine amidase AmpD